MIILTDQEKQIYELLKAAKEENLVTDYQENSNYVSCYLDDIHYEICFGENPDSEQHPNAERAIRASRFITRLMDKVKKDYSCYYVQYNTIPPEKDLLNNKLFGNRTHGEISISDPPKEAEHGVDWFFSHYEIEVEIVAAVGDIYERMVDYLTVDMKYENGEGSTVYTHKHIDKDERSTFSESELDAEKLLKQGAAQNQASEILNFILNGQLPGESANESCRRENIQKMLSVLAASESSQFCQFLGRVSIQEDAKVGQLTVKPCALLIDAVNDKKYVYRFSCNREIGDLSVIWRSSLGAFEVTTQLYLYLSESQLKNQEPTYKFEGLTNIPNEYPINDFGSLVLAHKVEKNGKGIKIIPDKWTLKDPNFVATLANGENQVRAINNYAVGVERNGVTKHFYIKDVFFVDNNFRLKSECRKCPLTGKYHYYEHFSAAYYLKDQKIEFGDIYTSGVHSFTCEICGRTIYYSSEKQKDAYLASHILLDGKHSCDNCQDRFSRGAYTYQKTENVICGNRSGTVYALVDTNGFLPIEKNGNVFTCANCGQAVLHDNKSEDNRCQICQSRVCSRCATNSKISALRPKVVNKGELACRNCLSKDIIQGCDGELKLFEVESDDGMKQYVLDDAKYPGLVFHCVVCGKAKYYDKLSYEKFRRCSSCDRIICPSCVDKCKSDASPFRLIFCPNCATECDDKYDSEKKKAEEIYSKVLDYLNKRENTQTRAKHHLENHVKKNIKKYLPYLTLADRSCVRKSIRNNDFDRNITIEFKHVAVLEKKITYEFTISVYEGDTYLFYKENDRVTYGGICNE